MDAPQILIIDDDPGLRKTLSDILRVKGYDISVAETGGEGSDLMERRRFNVALIDLGLPDIPGLAVLERIKTARPYTEVIILTGQATLDSAVAATNKGAFSYMIKPYDIDQLLLQIRRAIEKQTAEEKIAAHGRELQKMNAELKALFSVSNALSRSLDMNEFLPGVLRAMVETEIFPFEIRAALFLVEGGKMRLAASASLSGPELDPCAEIESDGCLCGMSLTKGEVLISMNSAEDQRHAVCRKDGATHGHVVVPLKTADKVVGLMNFYVKPETEINEDQIKLLTAIGSQIGIAVNNAKLYEETRDSSLHDPLTGLANRRFLHIQFDKCIELAKRNDRMFSVIMADIDHFKRYNDTYGHIKGDKALARVAGVISKAARKADYIFRYGGEEFFVILLDTDSAMAGVVAERIRKTVEAEAGVTISLGVASYKKNMETMEAVTNVADAALYQAKQKGRNRVEISGG